jgi:hypothetical protein
VPSYPSQNFQLLFLAPHHWAPVKPFHLAISQMVRAAVPAVVRAVARAAVPAVVRAVARAAVPAVARAAVPAVVRAVVQQEPVPGLQTLLCH